MRKANIAVSVILFLMAMTAAASDKQIHKTVPLDPSGSLSIDTHNGTITVTTWNQPTVDVTARIERSDWASEEDVAKTDVKVTPSAGSVRIESDYTNVPTHYFFFGESHSLPLVHYTISMPATARLSVEAHNTNVRVTSLRSDLRINTHNGSIEVNDYDGAATIETHNGDVRVAYSRFAKSSRFESHNGGIDIRMPAQARFHLNADGHHIGLNSDFPMTIGSSSSSHYVGDVNGGGPELRISTHNGSLHLRKGDLS